MYLVIVTTYYDILSDFSDSQNAVLLWMHDPAGRDAVILRQTLVLERNLEAATELICARTPSMLQYLKQIYHSKFGVFVEHDIESYTSGDHKKVRFPFAIGCGFW